MSQITVPLLDLKAQYAGIKDEIEKAVLDVLDSQWFILGPNVQECERRIAEYCNCEHAVGVSSGSDALLICLMAEGIGPGDEVITTPYTFFATVGCISRVGAKPVLVDICPETYNIDPRQIEGCITQKTKAIIPVHLFGQCASMAPILDIAERHGLVVIEDAAQAIGAGCNGRRAGSMGHYGCFSFFPSKNLGCAGDGGMVTTSDEARADRLRCLRAHGSKPKYYHKLVGGNFRLDALQATIVNIKLRHLDSWSAARQQNADRYRKLFQEHSLSQVSVPASPDPSSDPASRNPQPDQSEDREQRTEDRSSSQPVSRISNPASGNSYHIYNQFVIRVPRRDELKAYLKERGIGTEIYYARAMHVQECFSDLGYKVGDMPESEKAAAETLALPIYPELTDQQQQYVVETIAKFYANT